MTNELRNTNTPHDWVFGLWTDTKKNMRVRIAPSGNFVRMRIVEIVDRSIIDAIVFFCGLHTSPKRSNWKDFDLVTRLHKQDDSRSFAFGEVHLPKANKRTSASLFMLDKSHCQLNFLESRVDSRELYTGSILFEKEEWKK